MEKYGSFKLSDALNELRKQTSKGAPSYGPMRNAPTNYRTTANTPKGKRLSMGNDILGDPTLARQPVSTIINFKQLEVKPRLLETKITEDENFMKVTDGFKRLFSNDREDKRIVIPISGYGGHRRGDRS